MRKALDEIFSMVKKVGNSQAGCIPCSTLLGLRWSEGYHSPR